LMAKEPRAGYAKTRLSPAVGSAGAAEVAAALLADALTAVSACSAERLVVAYAGEAGPWLPPGIQAVPQRGGDLGERLAGVVEDVGAPLLVVAADSPEMNAAVIDRALGQLRTGEHDAVLGRARDGGYWCIGLVASRQQVFQGVPMSAPDTADRQLQRMAALGLRVVEADLLWDVDDEASADAAADGCPAGRFVSVWRSLRSATRDSAQ
jgi:rSAM/selenodomain-associated transferase 1